MDVATQQPLTGAVGRHWANSGGRPRDDPGREVVEVDRLADEADRRGVVGDAGDAADLVAQVDIEGSASAAGPAFVVVAGHEDLGAPRPRRVRGEQD